MYMFVISTALPHGLNLALFNWELERNRFNCESPHSFPPDPEVLKVGSYTLGKATHNCEEIILEAHTSSAVV
jgi:hypothetical protein